MIGLRLQLRIGTDTRIGPGKIILLETVARTGSISAAAREMEMTYRRAWELIDHMNKAFGQPLIHGQTGKAGGASLTEFGLKVIETYRRIELDAKAVAAPHLESLGAIVPTVSVDLSQSATEDDD
ncbi:winged helix-turn-helix domain-containing protein [Oryzibacter oryziterrae]|uniref:winged helix-turn-helix domain-containing protein n=1 Tax=Oryzibacter oryziterrae TaxID=2766474 RepID=UPI001F00FFF0|nr:LysR family transcriptional regulator [Oryzibacter oryziterrae]